MEFKTLPFRAEVYAGFRKLPRGVGFCIGMKVPSVSMHLEYTFMLHNRL